MFLHFGGKKTATLAVTASLITGLAVSCLTPSAATFCTELNLVGIAQSLDKYVDVDQGTESSSDAETTTQTQEDASQDVQAASGTAVSGQTATGAQAEKKKEPEEELSFSEKQRLAQKKRLAKRFSVKAISTARDYVNIRRRPTTKAKVRGKLYRGCAAQILKTKGKWVEIKSGNVTGWINKDYLATGNRALKLAARFGVEYATVRKGVVTVNVRSRRSTESSIVTQISEDCEYEVIGESTNWYKIEVDGDTHGFVSKDYVDLQINFKHAISLKEERAKIRAKRRAKRAQRRRLAALARQKAAQRRATSHSGGSTSSGGSSSRGGSGSTPRPSGTSGQAVANYALRFVGNPYVWGGSSLTNGADCSGFTMAVYAQFGYSLPHYSAAQASCGRAVSLSSVQPGDLIFYRHGSTIGHVAMYIGGGRIVHAASRRTGIITSNMYYNQPSCARRIVN